MVSSSDDLRSFNELASGEKIVYLATRLYDLTEKAAADELETAVLAGLADTARRFGISQTAFPTFMPYRDTVETIRASGRMVDREHQARSIYEDDLERLSRLFALVTYLNDPSKDDGICFEIGYAFATGVPVLAVVTDFIHYSSIEIPTIEFEIDPILLRMVGKIVRHRSFPPSGIEKQLSDPPDYDLMMQHKEEFASWLREANSSVLAEVRNTVAQLAADPASIAAPTAQVSRPSDNIDDNTIVFLDFAGGMYEWGRRFADQLADTLAGRGFDVKIGRRHDPRFQRNLINKKLLASTLAYELGNTDLSSALSAHLLVFAGDGMEVQCGTAALIGAARAAGKKIVLYYSGNLQTNAADREPTSRNLMIQYAADAISPSIEDIPRLVEGMLTA